jgi:glycerol-3-phosphate O-acyltransferase / dihydroxyacetone phosphate acyltransferase
MRLSPFLWLLYHLLRGLVWIAIRIFYRHVTIRGREHLRDVSGPFIVVINHPSTLADVLVPCPHVPRVLFFLANYGLFKHPVSNWILRRLYCIPVKRREDVAEGELRNNDDAFDQSIEHLTKGGALFVAVEGVSWMDRWVRPLKTGTARIALGALARQQIQEVRILPIGLSYTAVRSQEFRSSVVMQVGTPIYVSKWLADWNQDPMPAAEAVMQAVRDQLIQLTIHTEDESSDRFIGHLEDILHHARPQTPIQEFERAQRLTHTHLHDTPLRDTTFSYVEILTEHRTSDLGIQALTDPLHRPWFEAIALILLAPFAVIGWLAWAVPCWLPGALARWMGIYKGYDSTIKFVVGFFFTFPLALWLLWRGVLDWTGSAIWYLPAIAALVVVGLGVEMYTDLASRWLARRSAQRLQPEVKAQLQSLREKVLASVS